jgi:hypothetical protein
MVVAEAKTITRLVDSANGELVTPEGKNPQYAPVKLNDVEPIQIKHKPFVVVFSNALTVTNQVPAVSEILRAVIGVFVKLTLDDNDAWT